jgi:polyphosphate kinase
MRYYIGSADLMPRNLDGRVELLAPVEDPELRARLDETLDLALRDDGLAWTLDDATWRKVPVRAGLRSQEELMRLTAERARID